MELTLKNKNQTRVALTPQIIEKILIDLVVCSVSSEMNIKVDCIELVFQNFRIFS